MTSTADIVDAPLARSRLRPDILHEPPEFFDQLPIAICACDAKGRLRWFNRRAAGIWNMNPRIDDNVISGCFFHMYGLNGQPLPQDQTPMAKVLTTGLPIHGKDVVLERTDGTRVTVMLHIDPIFDAAGELIGALSCFHDITRMKAAEHQARDSERRLRDLLEALPVAVYTTDAQGYITSFNEAAAELWQRRPTIGESQWCGSWRLRTDTGELMPHDQCPMALTLKEQGDFRGREAMLERRDGTCVPFLAFPSLLRNSAGRITGAVNIMVDISDRKRAEVRQKTLIDELNHRVKNTLATVQSLAANTAREASVPDFMRETFESRLIALSRTHDHLTLSGWQSADLKSIVDAILPQPSHDWGRRIDVSGPAVELTPRQGLALAMVLNELTANAIRHGSLANPAGTLKMSWTVKRRKKSRWLEIDWTEIGGTANPPNRKGFGIRLIERSILGELSGTLDFRYRKTGLHGVIAIPLG